MITNLSTFNHQRSYLQKKGITEPLPLGTLERIGSAIAWSHLQDLENAHRAASDDLKLLPGDNTLLKRKKALEASIADSIQEVKNVLEEIRRESGAAAIKRSKAEEIYKGAKTKILSLQDELTADANRYQSSDLANLARSIGALVS